MVPPAVGIIPQWSTWRVVLQVSLALARRTLLRCSPPRSAAACLAVENDDRPGMYSISDLLPLHHMAGTPLVFDYLHHALAPGKLSEEEALLAALDTWPHGVRPVVHYRCGAGCGVVVVGW